MMKPDLIDLIDLSTPKALKRYIFRFEWLILLGLIIALWAMSNVLGFTNTNSDWFWAIAGFGLAVEGVLELYYEKKSNKIVFDQGRVNEAFETLSQKMNDDPFKGVVTLTHGSTGITMPFHTFKHTLLKNSKESKE